MHAWRCASMDSVGAQSAKVAGAAADGSTEEAAQLLSAVTGWNLDAAELESVGHRIVNLRKAFNIREGWKPTDDTLPERFFRESLDEGPSAGAQLSRRQLGEMIRSYNRARGWSPDGFLDEATQSEIARDLALGREARA